MSKDLTTLDPNHPDGATETVPTLATYEKETRLDLKDWGGVEHQLNGGYHKFQFGNTAGRPVTGVGVAGAGSIYINTQTGVIEYFDGTNWQVAIAPFASGTRMVFDQDTAPTGWTRDVTINDVVMTLVSGARVHGGSWTITGLSESSHIHGMGNHTHSVSTVAVQASGTALGVGGPATTGPSTNSTDAANSTILADGTWRPAKRDMIVCSKN